MRRILILFLLIAVGCVIGCGRTASDPENGVDSPRVVAGTSIIADVVRAVAGDEVEVTSLTPADSDPHNVHLQPADLRMLEQTGLLFAAGGGVESFLGQLVQHAGLEVVTLCGAHQHDPGADPHPHHHRDQVHDHAHLAESLAEDPHCWMDPTQVAMWLPEIADALAVRFPSLAEGFRERASAYRRQLEELDAWIEAETAGLPEARRLLVTDHRVLGHFAARYGFTEAGVILPGGSTLVEPSAGAVVSLKKTIQREGVPAVFVGVGSPVQLAETVAEESGVEVVRIYTGALSGPEGPASTYLDLMRFNTHRIVEALAAGVRP